MTLADFKINDRFRLNGAGSRKAEIFIVLAIQGDGLLIIDERDIVYDKKHWATFTLWAENVEEYSRRGFIEMLPDPKDLTIREAINQRADEIKAKIVQAEANVEDVPLGSEINYDIHKGVVLVEKEAV